MSKTDNTTTQATAKSRPSLMSGLALAGQQYFDAPYNIPSTFGDFYVGSPTAVVSNFVPMPLDFMQQQGEDIQAQYDLATSIAQEYPEIYQQMVQAAPYNMPTREAMINEYQLKEKPKQWSKDLLLDPSSAKRIAQEVFTLGEKFKADPRTAAIKNEYDKWKTNLINASYTTGWSNFWDPAKQQFISLDPTKMPSDFTEDKHMEYLKQYYVKDLTASVKETLSSQGIKYTEDPVTGIISYTKPGSTTVETIDPKDPNNSYVSNAISGLADVLLADPHPQASRIIRSNMGIQEKDQAIKLLTALHAPQFYKKETVTGGDQGIVPGQDLKGKTGTGTSSEDYYYNTVQFPITKVATPQYSTFKDLNTFVNQNTYNPEGNVLTQIPIRGASDLIQSLGPQAAVVINNTKEGEIIPSPDGKGTAYTTTNKLEDDVLKRSGDWGATDIQGDVTWTWRKKGDDVIPEIQSLNVTYKDELGNTISAPESVVNSVRAELIAKQQKVENAYYDRKELIKKVSDAEYAQIKSLNSDPYKRTSTQNRILNKVLPVWLEDNFTKTKDNSGNTVYTDKKTNKSYVYSQIVDLFYKDPSAISEQDYKKYLAKTTPEEAIADKITEEYFKEPSASVTIIDYNQGGEQLTDSERSDASKEQSSFQASIGQYKGDAEKGFVFEGNELWRNLALDKGQLVDFKTGESIPLAKMGLKGKEDYNKYLIQLNYSGWGTEAGGTPYFYFTAVSHNPLGTAGDGDAGASVNGQTVKVPMSTFSQTAERFGRALSLNQSKELYAQSIGSVIMSSKRGTIKNLSDKTPWVRGSSDISFARSTGTPQPGQGATTRVVVRFDKLPALPPGYTTEGNSVIIEGVDGATIGRELFNLNKYTSPEAQTILGGQGGSSMGKPQLGAKK